MPRSNAAIVRARLGPVGGGAAPASPTRRRPLLAIAVTGLVLAMTGRSRAEPPKAPAPAAGTGGVREAAKPAGGRALTASEVIARSEASVAVIRSKRAIGTGFLVGPGILVTNAHVIEGEIVQNLEIRFPSAEEGKKGPTGADLLYRDRARDLAMLAVKTELTPLELAAGGRFLKGEEVTVIGNPGIGSKLVLENAISRGIVSARAAVDGQDFLQLGISINPGNSGGPVLDSAGKVLGVATLKAARQEALAFCIPVADVAAALAKVAERPGAAAGPAGRDLKYDWKPGPAYVYAVRVAIETPAGPVVLEGTSLYRVKSVEADGIVLAHRSWLTTRRRDKEGKLLPGGLAGPGNPAEVELKVDPKGDLVTSNGAAPLPLLGDLSMLMIEPFPDGPQVSWQESRAVSLREVQASGGGVAAVAGAPVQFGRPGLRDRMGPSRLRGGSRLMGVRPRGGVVVAPAPVEVKVTEHPAEEQVGYGLGETSGDAVAITKSYELVSREAVEDEPRLRLTGGGEVRFDAKAGVPLGLDYKAKLVETSEYLTIRVPISVSCRLLAGAERDRAMIPPVLPPTAQNPITPAEVSTALTDVKSPDDGTCARALERLRDAAPVEARRAEVSRVLEVLVAGPRVSVRSLGVQALGVWGDSKSAGPLIAHLDAPQFGARNELFEALGRVAPSDAAAEAMIGWLSKDVGAAGRILRAMGPGAEPALLKAIRGDGPTPGRVEACRVLKDIGTARSIPALSAAVKDRPLEELGRVAEESIRLIAARDLDEVRLAEIALDLGSTDNNKRNRAIQQLASARPVEAGRGPIARALERALDEPDDNASMPAARALAAWGDAGSAEILVAHIRDRPFRAWREAGAALMKLAPDEAAASALATRAKEDRVSAFQLFRALGPKAEPAVIALLEAEKDVIARTDYCILLRDIGTDRCVPALKAIARNKQDVTSGSAESILKAIAQRRPADGDLAVMLVALRSADGGHRREALERLAQARPDDGRRGRVARAVEPLLNDPDLNVQVQAARTLMTWGDAKCEAPLAARVADRANPHWKDAASTLARVAPVDRATRALIARLDEDAGLITLVLSSLGPGAEPIVIEAYRSDPGIPSRVRLARLLGALGTEASFPVLRDAAARTGDGIVAAVAEEALRNVTARQ